MEQASNVNQDLHNQWRKAHRAFKQALKPILIEFTLSKVDAKVILVMQKNNAHSKADLAQHLNFEPACLTRSLERLVARGAIERNTDPKDKRFIRLQLTPAGLELANAYKSKVRAVWRKAFSGLNPEQKAHFQIILQTIIDNLTEE